MKNHTCAVDESNFNIADSLEWSIFAFSLKFTDSLFFSLSFQQTPVFWEEEEVSEHPLFFIIIIISLFFPMVLKRLKLYSSDPAYWHICILGSAGFMTSDSSVYFAPSVYVKCGWMQGQNIRA